MAQVTTCSLRVSSVEEFLAAVDQAFSQLCAPSLGGQCELWYRGQARSTFDLIPSIARGKLNPEMEIVFLSKFKSLVIPYVEPLPAPLLTNGINSYWNWLFQMQHYGVPTRLLDWSRDALTALFFATDPTDPSLVPGIDSSVWVLNPVTLNTAFSFHSFVNPGYIPNVEEPQFNLFFGPDSNLLSTNKSAAAIGPLNSTRIVAQRGTFTVFPLKPVLTPLNLFSDSSDYLFEICIASESIPAIQTQLRHYGITRITLFPEIQAVANEITQEVLDEGQDP